MYAVPFSFTRAGSVPGLVVPEDFEEPLEELREYRE